MGVQVLGGCFGCKPCVRHSSIASPRSCSLVATVAPPCGPRECGWTTRDQRSWHFLRNFKVEDFWTGSRDLLWVRKWRESQIWPSYSVVFCIFLERWKATWLGVGRLLGNPDRKVYTFLHSQFERWPLKSTGVHNRRSPNSFRLPQKRHGVAIWGHHLQCSHQCLWKGWALADGLGSSNSTLAKKLTSTTIIETKPFTIQYSFHVQAVQIICLDLSSLADVSGKQF